jgi:hypothetical protein
MNEAAISALLDAHDLLVRACLEDRLSFPQFVAAYGDFPAGSALEEDALMGTRASSPLGRRIEFHRQVASVLSGYRRSSENEVPDDLRVFLQTGIMRRLQAVVWKYPELRVEL